MGGSLEKVKRVVTFVFLPQLQLHIQRLLVQYMNVVATNL